MMNVGITGGMGSGKTLVCRIFETLQIPVYYADDRAKQLMHTDEKLKNQIKENFGEPIYPNDQLDRKALADIVFKDKDKLKLLNSLVHPAVQRDTERWSGEHAHYPYVIKEAALLFESGAYRQLDFILTVTCPEAIRIQRIIQRDNTSEAAVRDRMANQWPEKDKVALSDGTIVNDGKEMIVPQVYGWHEGFIHKGR